MWKCLFLAAMIVAVAAVPAAALPVCNEGYDAGVDVTTITQCTVGPFIFSNFSVSSGLNMAGAQVGLSEAWYDEASGTYYLTFGTNFNVLDNQDKYRDVIFSYQITGPLYGIDGGLGGSGTRSIVETVCAQPFVGTGCAPESTLATLVLNSQNTVAWAPLNGMNGTYYVVKDISLAPGATLSDFTQSYHVPEPAALVLIGSGLIALGLLRRRKA
ncbi:MAG TPA: VPLPA-CTERM sorting domain-containing protein [Bryobacteraceae bacterium]|nr:VPLPA-CTERM sorting domain-containing protein [Bryobacteraceae bacterium]HOL71039.1 VPLPA-CTERM sorting domain-containing protein [Bryobacteraceae bacterium]HOQ44175.1 VPLPA-CTERM sorting domain-containing protein [Bryobacteraceae bacterium]HPQ13797.1 VPLPA-CTERM sorting domain-containing protein [Bryobacteraceae bacterium]HPU70493.1 VPLPA-CTERM sorting domain-containing protein [Bryobacteraceae bacterium]